MGRPLSGDALADEIVAHELGGMTDEVFGRSVNTLEGRAWYVRAWQAVKNLWRSLLSRLGMDRVKLDRFMKMKPHDAAKWIVEQMAAGRRLGRLSGTETDAKVKAYKALKTIADGQPYGVIHNAELGENGNPIITGYEISADVSPDAYPAADGTTTHPLAREDEIVAALKNWVSQPAPDVKSADGKRSSTVSEEGAAQREYDEVVRRYTNSDGTRRAGWIKAPNGRSTNLTERQWVQVRTPSFKKWFGDWEKSGRLTKLRAAAPISLDWDGKYDLNQKSAREWMLANIRDTYENRDTGDRIRVSREGIKKVTSHGMYDETHLKSMSIVPQMIRDSIFIDELDATSEDKKYDKYRYYVAGVKINGEDYTAKVVIGIKNGEAYYDHNLTKIEKGNLIDALNKVDNPVASKISLDGAHDTKLLKILQLPSSVSKVVDENGEPKVVYHATDNAFTVFDRSRLGENTDRNAGDEAARRMARLYHKQRRAVFMDGRFMV